MVNLVISIIKMLILNKLVWGLIWWRMDLDIISCYDNLLLMVHTRYNLIMEIHENSPKSCHPQPYLNTTTTTLESILSINMRCSITVISHSSIYHSTNNILITAVLLYYYLNWKKHLIFYELLKWSWLWSPNWQYCKICDQSIEPNNI